MKHEFFSSTNLPHPPTPQKIVFASPSERGKILLIAPLSTWTKSRLLHPGILTLACYFWLHICARDNADCGCTAFKRVCITRLSALSITVSSTDLHPRTSLCCRPLALPPCTPPPNSPNLPASFRKGGITCEPVGAVRWPSPSWEKWRKRSTWDKGGSRFRAKTRPPGNVSDGKKKCPKLQHQTRKKHLERYLGGLLAIFIRIGRCDATAADVRGTDRQQQGTESGSCR